MNAKLEFLKSIIDGIHSSNAEAIVVSLFETEQSSKERDYGLKSAKIYSLSKKVILRETSLDLLEYTQNQLDLRSTLENYLFYLSEGGRQSSDANLQDVWTRYLNANTEINAYQRILNREGGMVNKTDTSSLQTGSESKVVPVSLLDYTFPKKLDQKMRQATQDQSKLWSKISGDFSWLKQQLES